MNESKTTPAFQHAAMHGSMFAGKLASDAVEGLFSTAGGEDDYTIAINGDRVGFKMLEAGDKAKARWAYCPITYAAPRGSDALKKRSHKGYVVFKGQRLHLWLNFKTGHEGDPAFARYDLKPSTRAALPF